MTFINSIFLFFIFLPYIFYLQGLSSSCLVAPVAPLTKLGRREHCFCAWYINLWKWGSLSHENTNCWGDKRPCLFAIYLALSTLFFYTYNIEVFIYCVLRHCFIQFQRQKTRKVVTAQVGHTVRVFRVVVMLETRVQWHVDEAASKGPGPVKRARWKKKHSLVELNVVSFFTMIQTFFGFISYFVRYWFIEVIVLLLSNLFLNIQVLHL